MGKYRIDNEQYFMLTYPTTPIVWAVDDLIRCLDRLGCDYRIGRELHQDGKPHFHAMLCFADPYSDNDARKTFTVDGRVPNIRVRRSRPDRGWDYVGKHAGTKEGHYIVAESGERPMGDSEDRPSNDVWHEIILARTREEFFDKCQTMAPRQLACSFTQLSAYADWKYAPAPVPYESPPGEFVDIPEELTQWVSENITNKIGRPRALCLFGGSRLGKTTWARSLGHHFSIEERWDMKKLDETAEYAVFNDMRGGLNTGYFGYKTWLGGQFEFTVEDKYCRKKTIKWGKATIWTSNEDPRLDEKNTGIDWDWMDKNCVFYELTHTIFRANTG
nr:MAG: replication-associated protein [Gemykolovirus]